ncbi:MAG: serine hydrolase domain-containing protein [Corynebacterium sp.]|nr:serine hydrolase domain-containing protein [Corynebacterium sp.]
MATFEDFATEVAGWPVERQGFAFYQEGQSKSAGDTGTFALASISKLLSAWTILIAVDRGHLTLDTRLARNGATVAELLSHAGGVDDYRERYRTPGLRRIYSSLAYDILADGLHRAQGLPFAQYMRLFLCDPLGMNNTYLDGRAGVDCFSTLPDLLAFMKEVDQPTLLSPETAKLAGEVAYPNLDGVVPGYGLFRPCDWGMGFELKGTKKEHWMGESLPPNTKGHFGQAGTFFWHNPENHTGAILLTNCAFGPWASERWGEFNTRLADLSLK